VANFVVTVCLRIAEALSNTITSCRLSKAGGTSGLAFFGRVLHEEAKGTEIGTDS
jgi:hypothetical protein